MALINNFLALVLFSTLAVFTLAGISYNSNTQVCCNGTVYDTNDTDYTSCCGNEAYNYKEEVCCYGNNNHNQLLPVPGNDSYDYSCCYHPETHIAELYNYYTQLCCNGISIDKPDKKKSYGCCGEQIYDYETEFCCADKVTPKVDNVACCGELEEYNLTTQTCCTSWEAKEDGTYGIEFIVSDNPNGSNTTSCCGLVAYNYELEVCCNDVISPLTANEEGSYHGCCGHTPYNYETQICCQSWGELETGRYGLTGTIIHNQTSEDKSCCGLQLYNHSEEVCCQETGTTLPVPQDTEEPYYLSCCGGKLLTNYTTQLCHNGEILEREGYDYYVCGDVVYHMYEQFCCNETVYDNDSGKACCYGSDTTYDTATEMCCHDVIEPLTPADVEDGNNACCSVYYYNDVADDDEGEDITDLDTTVLDAITEMATESFST